VEEGEESAPWTVMVVVVVTETAVATTSHVVAGPDTCREER
jgi:hypothetical protein